MKRFLSIFTDLLLFLLIIALVFNLYSIFMQRNNKDKNLSLFGYTLYIDVSSSMAPTIDEGDLIIAKKVEISELRKNDIIIFNDDESDISITHRITNVFNEDNKIKFETKGDSNNSKDVQLVSEDNVEGKYIFRIRGLGKLLLFFTTTMGIIVLVLIVITIILCSYLINIIFKDKKINIEE